jgi:tripartite-type tricarboxylate transporter receptor subunit TctC
MTVEKCSFPASAQIVQRLSPLGLALAFGAGLVSFASPCVLPPVPGYLAWVAGTGLAGAQAWRWRTLRLGAWFVLGFGAVFVAPGAGATGLSGLLRRWSAEAAVAGGARLAFAARARGAQHRRAEPDRPPRPVPVREDSMHRLTLPPLGRRAALAALAGAATTAPLPAPAEAAQDALPAREIRLLVGFSPGSNTDLLARVLAAALQRRLRRPVRVENRPGTGGGVAAEAVMRAAPDGATLGFGAPTLAIAQHVTRGLSYDPRADLTWISIVAATPVVLLAAPNHPARDLRSLGEALRARPDTRCGTPGADTFLHLATALLTHAVGAGCEAVHYDDLERARFDLQAGRLPLYANHLPVSLAMMREGRARALAIASRERHPLAPEVPTVAETVPGFELVGLYSLVAPRGVPAALAARLERAAVEAARDPAVAARLHALGAEPVGVTGAELAARLREEDAKWGAAVRAATN